MIAGGYGYEQPNASYMNGRGFWLTYLLILAGFHFIILSIPMAEISIAWAWTLTNLLHNTSTFYVFHWIKSHPWITTDQGSNRRLTLWEQIDFGDQHTPTRKFLMCVPIVLFIATCFYTRHDNVHFMINCSSLICVLAAKLPVFDRVRLFGINKY